jgi:hypothetical protein
VVVVVEMRILQGFAYACAEERWRREAAEIGCYERIGQEGAPPPFYLKEGGAPGEGES